MPRVFISYRRDDSSASSGRIFDRLKSRFGEECVFRDLDTIPPGAKFAEVIAEQMSRCDVLIAIIGQDWLNAQNAEGHRRLDDPADFVKAEISAALRLDKMVIPCLVEGATMSKRNDLPSEIAALADRNAIEISEARFDYDVDRLIQAIDPLAVTALNDQEAQVQKDAKTGYLRSLLYAIPLSLLFAVLFLVFADIALDWHFEASEVSLITLLALGLTIMLFRITGRSKSSGQAE